MRKRYADLNAGSRKVIYFHSTNIAYSTFYKSTSGDNIMPHFSKFIVLSFVCFTLAACAGGSRSENMSLSLAPDEQGIRQSSPYFQAIAVENITGGKETNPMLVSKVDNVAFQEALENSFANYGLLNQDSPKYILDAELMALEQPVFGLNFTVDSVVDYTLMRASNKSVVFKETIKASGEATMGDSFIGVERLRMANEASIRNNIKAFIDQLENQ